MCKCGRASLIIDPPKIGQDQFEESHRAYVDSECDRVDQVRSYHALRDEPIARNNPRQQLLKKPSQQSARHAKRDGYVCVSADLRNSTSTLQRERCGCVSRTAVSISKSVLELQPEVLLEELDDIAEQDVAQRTLAAIDFRSHVGTDA